MATNTALGGAAPRETTLRRVVIAATIGNVLEWFDFVIYGFLAVRSPRYFSLRETRPRGSWSRSAHSGSPI
jgi:hypothetical protein